MKKAEYLSEDILDDAFINIFKPYFYIQKIMGSCRVDARDRFISAPTIYQKLYTIIITAIILVFQCIVYRNLHNKYAETYRFLYYVCILIQTVHVNSFINNIIHVRFLNSSKNIKLYLDLQRIDRSLKLDQEFELYSLEYRIHIITSVTLVLPAAILLIYSCSFGDMQIVIINITRFYCESPFVLDLSQCSRLMYHFTTRVNIVNGIMWNYLIRKPDRPGKVILPSKTFLRYIAARHHSFESSETDNYLKEIFACFKICQNLYRYQILSLCGKLFIYACGSFEFTLLSVQYNVLDPSQLVTLGTVVAIDFVTVLFLSIRIELFFRAIKETKLLTISIMSIHLQGITI